MQKEKGGGAGSRPRVDLEPLTYGIGKKGRFGGESTREEADKVGATEDHRKFDSGQRPNLGREERANSRQIHEKGARRSELN